MYVCSFFTPLRNQPTDQTIWTLTRSVVALCFVSGAWPMLVFGTRPFSNSAEAVAIAVVWQLTRASSPSSRENKEAAVESRWRALACVCIVGVFLRFTFVFYALPLIVAAIHDGETLGKERKKKSESIKPFIR